MKYKSEDFAIKGTQEAFNAFLNASMDSVCMLDEEELHEIMLKAYNSCRPNRELKGEFVLQVLTAALCEHIEHVQKEWEKIAPADRVLVFQAMLQMDSLRNFFGNAIDRSIRDNAGSLYRKLGASIEASRLPENKELFKLVSTSLKSARREMEER